MRKLSKYQRRPWMRYIARLPHKYPSRKGENHPLCRLPDEVVRFIRTSGNPAKEDSMYFGITERYVYQLRAGERRK